MAMAMAWVDLLTDLKNMADRHEWKGQRFKKKHVKELKKCFAQYAEKHFFFQFFFYPRANGAKRR